ncbi:hypothetical protein PCE1_000563 [Barthelona sp. PCE]
MQPQNVDPEVQKANELRELASSAEKFSSKLKELYRTRNETESVIRSLERVPSDRKSFRLQGEILVEQPAGKSLIDMQAEVVMISETIKAAEQQYHATTERITMLTQKHNLQLRTQ